MSVARTNGGLDSASAVTVVAAKVADEGGRASTTKRFGRDTASA